MEKVCDFCPYDDEINVEVRERAEKVLIDNGIDKDEAWVVLQAIGYVLLDIELYPEYLPF